MKNKIQELFSNHSLIDLTHALHSQVPTWDCSCGFKRIIADNDSESTTQPQFQFQSFEMRAGIGTHMDAPLHCFKEGKSIADIDLAQLVLPLVVIDVSSHAHANYEIDPADIANFEKNHGLIPPGSLVIGHTGWGKLWNDPIKYRNADEKGQMHFPSFKEDAAKLLLARGASGIAIDTLSPDVGINGYFPVHELFLGAGKYLLENVANAHLLPPIGALGIVLPIKVLGGAEAPVRFIGII